MCSVNLAAHCGSQLSRRLRSTDVSTEQMNFRQPAYLQRITLGNHICKERLNMAPRCHRSVYLPTVSNPHPVDILPNSVLLPWVSWNRVWKKARFHPPSTVDKQKSSSHVDTFSTAKLLFPKPSASPPKQILFATLHSRMGLFEYLLLGLSFLFAFLRWTRHQKIVNSFRSMVVYVSCPEFNSP